MSDPILRRCHYDVTQARFPSRVNAFLRGSPVFSAKQPARWSFSGALKAIQAPQSVDPSKKIYDGAISIAELAKANTRIERQLTKLLNGRSSISDAEVLQDLIGHSVDLPGVLPKAAAQHPGVAAFAAAETAAKQFNICAFGIDETGAAYVASRAYSVNRGKLALSRNKGSDIAR